MNIPLVKTRDVYGFEVDGRRSAAYRAFYERFQHQLQRQAIKAMTMLQEGAFSSWSCSYSRGRPVSENINYNAVCELVRDGLPTKSRGEVWLQLTGVAGKVKLYEGVYESLLEPYEHAEAYGINNSPSTIQIEKDVPRTFPGYMWTPRGKQFQPSLRRLLRAYAMRNPRLGYCQSMNFIAGGLLLFLDEAEAFWLLCFVVEELLPDYFSKNIIGPQVDAEVLSELMAEQLPALRDHFDTLGLNTVLVCTQWFMCLFIRTLPYECAFRIWDSLFLNGPKVLFEVGLAILKMHQVDLLAFTDTIDIVTHLGGCLTDLFDCSVIWDTPIIPLEHKRITSCREIYKEKVLRDMRMKMDILDLMDVLPSAKFSREALESLYAQYANIGSKLDMDIVVRGLPKPLFQKIILNIFPKWKQDEYFLDRIFYYFDDNHNNHVNFKELISGLSVLCKGTNDEKLRMCFELFDQDGDGRINKEELIAMLTSIYKVWKDEPAEPEKEKEKEKEKEEKDSETTADPAPSPSLLSTPIFRTNSIRRLATSFPLLVRGTSAKNLLSTSSSAVPPPPPAPATPPASPSFVRLTRPPIELHNGPTQQYDKPKLSPTERRSPEKDRRSLDMDALSSSPSSRPSSPVLGSSRPSSPVLGSSRPSSPVLGSFRPSSPLNGGRTLRRESVSSHDKEQLPEKEISIIPSKEKDKPSLLNKDTEKDKDKQREKDEIPKEKEPAVNIKDGDKDKNKIGLKIKVEKDSQGREKQEQDTESEVNCFVDMFFKLDANKDGYLEPEEFKEAALLHPFILKIFNLGGSPDQQHQNYELRISIDE